MKKTLNILFFIILFSELAFSQISENGTEKLLNYKTLKSNFCESYGNWTYIYNLENGLITEQKNFRKRTPTLIKRNIYDKYKNLIFEISCYNINHGYKIDTIVSYKYKYDNFNRVIEKRYSFGLIETYSEFDINSKPKLIQRFNEDNTTLYFKPFKEEIEYDAAGNIVKENKTEIKFPEDKNDTIKEYIIETNLYKHDKFGNIIEIRRKFSPKVEFPIHKLGGFPLYEVEKFEYKYNKNGLWTKKYKIIEGKKILFQRRKFKK